MKRLETTKVNLKRGKIITLSSPFRMIYPVSWLEGNQELVYVENEDWNVYEEH